MKIINCFEIHCGADINKALQTLDHEFYVPVCRYREDHIFDEEQSVRWNREEVERQNQAQIELHKKALALRAESTTYFLAELYRYICSESVYDFTFTKAEAEVIWAETQKHHDQEPWNWVDDMAESMRNLILKREQTI